MTKQKLAKVLVKEIFKQQAYTKLDLEFLICKKLKEFNVKIEDK